MIERQFTLNQEELEQIEDWYNSAAGESATGSGSCEGNRKLKALLQKFGFLAHSGDQYEFEQEDNPRPEYLSGRWHPSPYADNKQK